MRIPKITIPIKSKAFRPQIWWLFNVLGAIAITALIMSQTEIAAGVVTGTVLIARELLDLEKNSTDD